MGGHSIETVLVIHTINLYTLLPYKCDEMLEIIYNPKIDYMLIDLTLELSSMTTKLDQRDLDEIINHEYLQDMPFVW